MSLKNMHVLCISDSTCDALNQESAIHSHIVPYALFATQVAESPGLFPSPFCEEACSTSKKRRRLILATIMRIR